MKSKCRSLVVPGEEGPELAKQEMTGCLLPAHQHLRYYYNNYVSTIPNFV